MYFAPFVGNLLWAHTNVASPVQREVLCGGSLPCVPADQEPFRGQLLLVRSHNTLYRSLLIRAVEPFDVFPDRAEAFLDGSAESYARSDALLAPISNIWVTASDFSIHANFASLAAKIIIFW